MCVDAVFTCPVKTFVTSEDASISADVARKTTGTSVPVEKVNPASYDPVIDSICML